MKEKIEEFYKKNKKKCAGGLILIIAGIIYCCFGSEIDQDKALELLCKIISCE